MQQGYVGRETAGALTPLLACSTLGNDPGPATASISSIDRRGGDNEGLPRKQNRKAQHQR